MSLRQPHGVSTAEWCRRNGLTPGTKLVGDEGYGPTTIVITAIGESSILARHVNHNGEPCRDSYREGLWTLAFRDWELVSQ